MVKTLVESNDNQVHIVIPPDGGYAWVIVVASFMSVFAMDGIVYSFGKHLKDIASSLNILESKVSIIGSVQLGLYYMCGPIVSAIVNHYGFRKVALSGSIIAFVGILGASYTSSYIGIMLLYGFLGGIGFGMIYSPSVIIIGYYFEKYRALSTGIAMCGSSVGTLFLSPLLAFLGDKYGWQITMRIEAALLIACMLSAVAYRQLEPTQIPILEETDQSSANRSKTEFVQIYKTNSLVTIDLASLQQESRNQPKINIISSRFVPISEMAKNKKKQPCSRCLKSCFRKLLPGKTRSSQLSQKSRPIMTGPLDRKDIFYGGSLLLLPEYKVEMENNVSRDCRPLMSYHLSMIHDIKSLRSLEDASDESPDEKEVWCFSISHKIKNAFCLLFDVSLLRSWIFRLLSLSNFCYSLAWFIPYIFLTERAKLNNISDTYIIWLISCIAIGNTIGRLSAGVITSLLPKINTCYLSGCFIITSGILTIIAAIVLTDVAIFQVIYCILLGFCIAFLNTLRSIVIVKLLGLDKLTNAFGLSAVVMGVGALSGTPIASCLKEATGSFLASFLMTGIFFMFSGLFIILAFHVYSWENQKKINLNG